MTILSRRSLLAGAVSLPAAGALPSASPPAALAPAQEAELVAAWNERMTAAIVVLRTALAAQEAAEARFRTLRPHMPAEIFVTAKDRGFGLSGDTVSDGRGGWLRDRRGLPVEATDSDCLRECVQTLGHRPALVKELKMRLLAVEGYESAWTAAEEEAGLPAAQGASFHSRRRVLSLVDEILDHGAGLAGAAAVAARGMLALAETCGDAAFDAWNRRGLELATLVACGFDAPPPSAAPLQLVAA